MPPVPQRDVLFTLFVPRSFASPPSAVLASLRDAAAQARSHLTILVPALGDIDAPARLFGPLQRLLSLVYTECAKELVRRDELLMPVDVILEDLLLRCGGSPVPRDGYATVLDASYDDQGTSSAHARPASLGRQRPTAA
jgi:hypothetical protein